MVDFSKAPEGATHYDETTRGVNWFRNGPIGFAVYDGCFDGAPIWISLMDCESSFKEIPQSLTVTCNNERELMLCEQVLRMCRGEASEQLTNTYWTDVSLGHLLNIHSGISYRAKPKKELVVPWEHLGLQVAEVTVHPNKEIWVLNDEDGALYKVPLALDLDGIDLPVTVKRPEGK